MMKVEFKQSGIYAIINTVNGKRYVGQSVNIKKRIDRHFRKLCTEKHHCLHLQSAFCLYGKGAFEFKILEKCDKKSLTNREQYWMDYYNNGNGIYNAAPAAGSCLGVKHTDATRAKVSLALTGIKRSEATRAKVSAAQIGRCASKDTCVKMSASHLGHDVSKETRIKISAFQKGKHVSKKTRLKLSKAQSGKRHTVNSRAKISAKIKEWWINKKAIKEIGYVEI